MEICSSIQAQTLHQRQDREADLSKTVGAESLDVSTLHHDYKRDKISTWRVRVENY